MKYFYVSKNIYSLLIIKVLLVNSPTGIISDFSPFLLSKFVDFEKMLFRPRMYWRARACVRTYVRCACVRACVCVCVCVFLLRREMLYAP